VSTLQSAFADDPLYRWLYPDPVERHAALEATFALLLDLASDRGEVAVTGDGTAVALWTPPLGLVASSSGFFAAGWVAWRRRSRTSPALRKIRYIVDVDAR
jgi:hypothetical protein